MSRTKAEPGTGKERKGREGREGREKEGKGKEGKGGKEGKEREGKESSLYLMSESLQDCDYSGISDPAEA